MKMFLKFLSLIKLLALCFLVSSCSLSEPKANPSKSSASYHQWKDIKGDDWAEKISPHSKLRGWEYLVSKLENKGIERDVIREIYSDESMPLWTPITFKVRPRESKVMYHKSNTQKARQNALQFYNSYKSSFKKSYAKLGVEPEIVLAILQIETQCGKNTGNQAIIYWLSRLVSAGFPPNIEYNVRNTEEEPRPSYRELEERAEWLEEEFMPHLISLINTSSEIGVSPISVKGSYGGAMGLTQFLPGNISKYGYDGDGDGVINIFVPEDAIFSVANFLKQHAWKKGLSKKEKRNIILFYNRSDAYADTVLSMSELLKRQMR